MTILLLAVGLLATAAGFVTIGFGIPINAFSLGNTLIIAGTITVAAGLLLIGIAIAVGHLKRIADALKARGPRGESVETMVPPTARMTPAAAPEPAPARSYPQPPAPEPPFDIYAPAHAPEPPLPEPRFSAMPPEPPAPAPAPAPAASAPGPLDWLRAKSKPASTTPVSSAMPTPSPMMPPMVEPPMVPDEAPLSPRPPLRPVMPPMAEPAMEPKVWSPDRGPAPAEMKPAPRVEQPMPRATPQPPEPKEKFDLVWPDRAPPASAPAPAAGPAEPARRDATLDMPLPPVPARPRDNRSTEKRDPMSPKPASERGPAILKSGVIDGMPYTLYADGSIEAELPKGTVKFASVDALRSHLEKNG